jgi:hypothetical protein
MAIGLKTHKLLWGRSGNRCAICRTELVEDSTLTDDEALVGEECHIVARSDSGPRADASMSREARDRVDNLVLLCRNHHAIIDSQPETYTVVELRKLKSQHEAWVRDKLGASTGPEPATLRLAATIDRWATFAAIDGWRNAYYGLVADGIPRLHTERVEALDDLRAFLQARFREPSFPEVEAALDVFLLVLHDLLVVFRYHAIECNDEWRTERFYKIREWDPERYERLSHRYGAHISIVEDLLFELTRATNLVIMRVRSHLHSSYRQDEGVVLVERGPDISLRVVTSRLEYGVDEEPYSSFASFFHDSDRIRFTRPDEMHVVDEYADRLKHGAAKWS